MTQPRLRFPRRRVLSLGGVDATTLDGKVLFGYQGWFGCLGDNSPVNEWRHWFNVVEAPPDSANLHVDFWPDISELDPDELYPTDMQLPAGAPLMAYSAYNARTVERHFEWMRGYGIDGIALQRFVGEVQDLRFFDFRNQVANNVLAAAEATGRIFYVEFDLSGVESADAFAQTVADWTFLVDRLGLPESSRYLYHAGRPVVELWGLGVEGRKVSAEQAARLIEFFRAGGPYQATVIGGVGSYWRTGDRDALGGEEWAEVYRMFDYISPWSVGRYANATQADWYRANVIEPDLALLGPRGVGYMPVVFPGFSASHQTNGAKPLNEIPRDCGRFYWRQIYNAIGAGAKTIFVAMFDEVDEGTAMYKLVPTAADLPAGAGLLALDADACQLPSDFYLRLGGETGKVLHRPKLRPIGPKLPRIPIKLPPPRDVRTVERAE